MSDKLGLNVRPAGADIIGQVDIICTATGAKQPLFTDSQLKAGVHIDGVGSFRPDMSEIPPETVKRARVFVDHFKSCRVEAGDFVQPLERGLFGEDHIKCELVEALIDENKGRANEYEVTFFKSVGIAGQDQFMASLIYDRAVDNNSGIVVSL